MGFLAGYKPQTFVVDINTDPAKEILYILALDEKNMMWIFLAKRNIKQPKPIPDTEFLLIYSKDINSPYPFTQKTHFAYRKLKLPGYEELCFDIYFCTSVSVNENSIS